MGLLEAKIGAKVGALDQKVGAKTDALKDEMAALTKKVDAIFALLQSTATQGGRFKV